MIKSILKIYPGFSINDVMDTDYNILISTIQAEDVEPEAKEEVMSLADFVRSI